MKTKMKICSNPVPTYFEEWRCEEPKYLACWKWTLSIAAFVKDGIFKTDEDWSIDDSS